MIEFAIYPVLGAFVGIVAGLLGVGGGLIIVPVLAFIFQSKGFPPDFLMQMAIGTSLATIVFTSISSVRAHHLRGAVLWRIFAKLTPGIVVGAWFGAVIADFLPGDILRIVFGIFELLVAFQMTFAIRPNPHRQIPGVFGSSLAGGIIGTISAIVGIGGGSLTVPFLTWCNVPIHKSVATSAASGLPIAIAGSIGFMLTGWSAPHLPPYSIGYVYLPALTGIVLASVLFAPLGARLAHILPSSQLKRWFALFLFLLGIHMLWEYFSL